MHKVARYIILLIGHLQRLFYKRVPLEYKVMLHTEVLVLQTPKLIKYLYFCLTWLTNPHKLSHKLLYKLLHKMTIQNLATIFNYYLFTLPTGQLQGFYDVLQLGLYQTVLLSKIPLWINTAELKLACKSCLAIGPASDSVIVWD